MYGRRLLASRQLLRIGGHTSKPGSAVSFRHGRAERGLTTLEWLLIVAAVAGLAALAVVLVQNVVDETAEEITGNNARVTAAQVAAARITSDARAMLPKSSESVESPTNTNRSNAQNAVNDEFASKCNRLAITYSDAEVKAMWFPADVAKTSGDTRGTESTENSAPTRDLKIFKTDSKALCEVGLS